MNIALKKSNKSSARGAAPFIAAAMLASMFLLFAGCNQDGPGIFYQISQEKAQKESKISERFVFQIVETTTDLYALAGRSVFKQVGDDWSNITGNHYAYDIVEYSGLLYININDDDSKLDDGTLYNYDGSSLSSEVQYNTDVHLFEADGTYILVKGIGSVDSVESTVNVTAAGTVEGFTDIVFDGASGTAGDYLISADTLYEDTFGSLVAAAYPPADKSDDYRGIASDGADIFLTTSSGQIYSSPDGGTWTLEDTISAEPVAGSLAVVTIGVTDYLIIGTDEGYYEMNIDAADPEAVEPTATTIPEFEAAYSDLALALIHYVYPSSAADVFYLGTQAGLWRRNSDGTFEKL
ncbi:MAG: hypothetical protein SVR04_15420 [Spirochaetota bacterium]|nr:hypothetical protein [Spirochaetota bacterium]